MDKIIDAHTHIFSEGTLAEYREGMGDREFTALVLYFWGFLGEHERNLEEVINFVSQHHELRLVAGFRLEKTLEPQLKAVQKLLKSGEAVGCKIYPGYERFNASDEIVRPIAELCESNNVPLIVHSGDTYDPKGTTELAYSHPMHIDALAVRFPKLNIVMAHFGFPYFLEAANIISKNKNVFADISGTITDCGSDADNHALTQAYIADLRRALIYFPDIKQKLLFGTDFAGSHTSLRLMEPYVELMEFVFSVEDRAHVYSGLAEKLFHFK